MWTSSNGKESSDESSTIYNGSERKSRETSTRRTRTVQILAAGVIFLTAAVIVIIVVVIPVKVTEKQRKSHAGSLSEPSYSVNTPESGTNGVLAGTRSSVVYNQLLA